MKERGTKGDRLANAVLNVGWFSSGKDEAARQLLQVAHQAIKDGTVAVRIVFVFSNRERGESRDSDLFLWQDGEPVSMAAKARPTRHGTTVILVYTPPALRGRGYATACVASLSQTLLDSGRLFCTLFADRANPISNHLYERIGYRPIGSFTELTFHGAGPGN